MKEIIKLGLILSFVCLVAAAALAFTNEVTADKIAEQRFLANEKAKGEVLSEAARFEDVSEALLHEVKASFPTVKDVSKALDEEGQLMGFVFKATPGGYGGPLEVVMGVTLDGVIKGVRIGNHQETPGLGAKAKDEPFYSQYFEKSASAPLQMDAIEAIAGATITSNAVTSGVNASIEAFNWLINEGGH